MSAFDVESIDDARKIIKELVESNKRLTSEVEYYRYDDLTGFLLRKDYNKKLDDAIFQLHNYNRPFMFAIADVNDLKSVNREYGYLAGDAYIKTVSTSLRNNFSECELYRIGGDEFAIIRNGACIESMESILKQVDNIEYGIVCVDSNEFKSVDDIVNHVDGILRDKKITKGRRQTDKE